jgi:hypothetical protein
MGGELVHGAHLRDRAESSGAGGVGAGALSFARHPQTRGWAFARQQHGRERDTEASSITGDGDPWDRHARGPTSTTPNPARAIAASTSNVAPVLQDVGQGAIRLVFALRTQHRITQNGERGASAP